MPDTFTIALDLYRDGCSMREINTRLRSVTGDRWLRESIMQSLTSFQECSMREAA